MEWNKSAEAAMSELRALLAVRPALSVASRCSLNVVDQQTQLPPPSGATMVQMR